MNTSKLLSQILLDVRTGILPWRILSKLPSFAKEFSAQELEVANWLHSTYFTDVEDEFPAADPFLSYKELDVIYVLEQLLSRNDIVKTWSLDLQAISEIYDRSSEDAWPVSRSVLDPDPDGNFGPPLSERVQYIFSIISGFGAKGATDWTCQNLAEVIPNWKGLSHVEYGFQDEFRKLGPFSFLPKYHDKQFDRLLNLLVEAYLAISWNKLKHEL